MKRAIFNQKGGVGKTSITCNLAASMAKIGRKTLVIDLDSQANSSQYLLGTKIAEVSRTVADFFEGTLSSFKLFSENLAEIVYATDFPNLYVIPAHIGLSELQPKLESRYKVFKLQQAVDALIASDRYDEILIDTPPALNFYSMSALITAERVVVPFDCDAFSAHALDHVMNIVDEVIADHRPNLKVEGIVINHFQAQAKLPNDAIAALKAKGYPILEPYLSTSIAMRESHSAHVPLPFFKPKHKLTLEFERLAKSLEVIS